MTFHTVMLNSLVVFPTAYGYDSASIGLLPPFNGDAFNRERLPAEAVGATTLTLTNVVIGSAIRIEVASTGALVVLRTATATTEVFTLDYYAGGSVNNNIRIKVRKGSAAPLYKPYETLATLGPAAQSVYIAQIAD